MAVNADDLDDATRAKFGIPPRERRSVPMPGIRHVDTTQAKALLECKVCRDPAHSSTSEAAMVRHGEEVHGGRVAYGMDLARHWKPEHG